MSSQSATQCKKTRAFARQPKKSSYHSFSQKKTTGSIRTNQTQQHEVVVFEYSKTSSVSSWDDLPDFEGKVEWEKFNAESDDEEEDHCPCEDMDSHFCHECAVCFDDCCGSGAGSSYIRHSQTHDCFDDSDSDSESDGGWDRENYQPFMQKKLFDWTDEFGWNDLGRFLDQKFKSVTWSNEVTVHDDTEPNLKLNEQDYQDYRRPYGGKAYKAGDASPLRGCRRYEVHTLRPDLQRHLSLEEINLKIRYAEADPEERSQIINSLAVFQQILVPKSRVFLELSRERKRFDHFMESVDFW